MKPDKDKLIIMLKADNAKRRRYKVFFRKVKLNIGYMIKFS